MFKISIQSMARQHDKTHAGAANVGSVSDPNRAGSSSFESGERGLRFVHQSFESSRLMNGNVRQNFAIHSNLGLVEAVDKSTIGQAMFTHSCVDPLNPQSAEIAFSGFAVAIGVLTGFLHCLLGNADGILAAAIITFGGFDNFFVTGVGGNAPFNSGHLLYSPVRSIRRKEGISSRYVHPGDTALWCRAPDG